MDTNGNFAVGGFSESTAIAPGGNAPNPILVFIEADGTERWYRNFNNRFDKIDSVAFNPDSTRLVFITNEVGGGWNYLVIINPSPTYTVVRSQRIREDGNTKFFQTFPGSILFTADALYIGVQLERVNDLRFTVLKFDTSVSYQWQFQLKRGDFGQVYSVIEGDSSDIYVGGWQQEGNNSNEDRYITVARILQSQGSQKATPNWIREDHLGDSKSTYQYYIRRLALVNSPSKKIVSCVEHTNPTTAPFGILEINLDGSNQPNGETHYEYEVTNEQLYCRGLYTQDSNIFYAYVSFISAQAQKFARITSSTQTIEFQDLPLEGAMTDSIIISATQSYYIGSLSFITQFTPNKSFSNSIAYLMSFDISQSCLTYSYTWGSAISMTSGSILFDETSSSYQNADDIEKFSDTLDLETQGSNSIIPQWCTDQRVISTPALTDPTYYVNDGAQLTSVPNFTLDQVCDDEAWTYEFHYMDPSANPTLPTFITRTNLDYSVQSNSYTDAGTYQMRIKGTLPNLQTKTRLFNIIVSVDCDKTIIAQGSFTSPQTYSITTGSATTLSTTAGWSQNIPSPTCPDMAFSITNQADDSAADGIFSVTGSNIQVNSQSYLKVGQYDLNLVATIGSVNSKLQFTVHVINPCSAANIGTTAVSAITYFTTRSAESVTVAAFTQDTGDAGCDDFTYFATMGDDSSLDASTFNFNPTTRVLSVSTSDIAKIATHSIKITGYIKDPAKKAELTFNVDIRDNCENVILTPATDKTQTYRVKDSSTAITSFNFQEDIGTCGLFTYSLTNFDNSAYDTSIFTFAPAAPTISIQTNDLAKVNTIELKVTATLGSWGSTFSKVTVTIEPGCTDSIVTPDTISAQTYQITDSKLTFTFNEFTSSVISCGAFTYSSYDFTSGTDTALDTNFIQFTGGTRTFEVETSTASYISTYTIKLVGTLAAGASAFSTFTLNIVNPCASSNIVTPTISKQTYYMFGTDLTYQIPAFSQDLVHSSCQTFTYLLTKSDDSAYDSTVFTFTPNTRTLVASSTDIAKLATYTFKVTGYLLQTSVSSSTTFDVDVLHVCSTVTITKASDQTVNYEVKAASQDITSLAFTENLGVCGSFSYTLANSDDTAFDSTVFTFDSSTPKISIQTNQAAKAASYTLKLTGTLNSWGSDSTLITINAQLGCLDTVITPTTMTTQIYYVTDPTKNIIFADWTSSVSGCGAFTYSATIASNALDSNYISFAAGTRMFSVATSDPQYIASYTVTITGSLTGGASQTYQFGLNIQNPCASATITPPSVSNQIYYIFGSNLVLTLPIFTQDQIHSACYTFTYELTNSDDSVLDPGVFTFVPGTRVLTVSSTDSGKIQTYTLKYVAYLLQKGVVQQHTTFQINVQHVCSIVVITAASPQTVGYSVQDSALSITSLAFSHNQGGNCGSFTYTLSNQDDSAYDNTIFTFTPATPSISVQTNLIAQAGTYSLKVTGTLGAWGSSTTIITVNIIRGCPDATITPSTISTQTYYITSSALSIVFSDWTSNVPSCGTFSYTSLVNGAALDSNYISFTSSTRTFSVTTNDPQYINTYTVTITGTLSVGGATNSMTFTLNIQNPCTGATFTLPTVLDQTYYLPNEPDLVLTLPVFISDQIHASCQDFTYELRNSDDSALDSGIFTFVPGTRVLTISSNDIGKIQVYTLKYVAYLLQTSVGSSMTFKITVLHACQQATITPASTQSIEYREKDPAVEITSLTFSEDKSVCGSFSYSLSNEDDSSYDSSIFTFDPTASNPKITVQTNLVSDVGTYRLKLTGTLGSYGSSTTIIQVNIILGCADTTITATTIPDQTYLITNPTLTITYTDWTSSVTLCGAFTYTATYTDDSALNSAYITFTAGTRSFAVTTSDPTLIGTVVIKIKGVLADGAESTVNFNLIIQNPCQGAVFTPPTISVVNYYVFGSDLNQILPQFNQNVPHPSCSQMTYSLTNSDDSALDASVFTFTASSRNLHVSTTDISKIATYNLKYNVYILESSVSSQMIFQLEIVHVCTIVQFTQPTIATQIYATHDPPKIISNLAFTEDRSGICGSFTYTLTNNDNSAIDTAVFTFDALTPQLTVQTSLASKIADYPLKLTATLGSWKTESITFTVRVVHGCFLTTITTDPIPNKVYLVTDSALTFTFNDWTSSISGCGAFTYSAKYQDQTNLNSAYITFSPSSRLFNILTSDIQYKGTYQIEVTGSMIDGASATVLFQLDIQNPCQASVIISSSPTNQVFTMPAQTTFDYVIPAFTQDLVHPTCSQFTYVVENTDNTAIDPDVFTFVSATRTLTIATTLVSKMGTYNFRVTGYLLETSISNTATFDVTIAHQCQVVTITAAASQTLFYYNKDPAIIISSLTFTENVGVCGSFTYYLLNQDNSAYDTQVFTFYSSTPTISVSTNNQYKSGVYYIKVIGRLGIWGQRTTNIQVTVYKACDEALITPYAIGTQFYRIFNPAMTITFQHWTLEVPGCGSFTYTVSQQDGSGLDSSIMSYDSGTRTFTIQTDDMSRKNEQLMIQIVGYLGVYQSLAYNFQIDIVCLVDNMVLSFSMQNQVYYVNQLETTYAAPQISQTPDCGYPIYQIVREIKDQRFRSLSDFIDYDKSNFVVFTDNEEEAQLDHQTHKIRVTYYLTDYLGKKESYYEWELKVLTQRLNITTGNSLPRFKTELGTKVITANQVEIYNFPDYEDPNPGEIVAMTLNCEQIKNFGSCQNKQILFKPKSVDVGTYLVYATLRDNHTPQGVDTFSLSVVIKEDPTQIVIADTVQQEQNDIPPMPIEQSLKAKIESVKQNGQIDLKFNQNVQMPAAQNIDSSVLLIKIFKDSDKLIETSFSWETILTTDNKIQIQLNFDDALSVSELQEVNIDLSIFYRYEI